MGKTSDSAKKGFGREIGKNAADYLSNKLLGDTWSTPHRVAVSVQKEQIRARTQEHETAALKAKLEYEKEKDFDLKLDSISGILFNTDKNDITNIISKVISTASFTLSKDGNEEKNLPIIKACVEKAEEGIFRLRGINAIDDADFYQKRLELFKDDVKIKERKDKRSNLTLILIIILGFGLMFGGYLLSKHR